VNPTLLVGEPARRRERQRRVPPSLRERTCVRDEQPGFHDDPEAEVVESGRMRFVEPSRRDGRVIHVGDRPDETLATGPLRECAVLLWSRRIAFVHWANRTTAGREVEKSVPLRRLRECSGTTLEVFSWRGEAQSAEERSDEGGGLRFGRGGPRQLRALNIPRPTARELYDRPEWPASESLISILEPSIGRICSRQRVR
jgi:hypothetical protein